MVREKPAGTSSHPHQGRRSLKRRRVHSSDTPEGAQARGGVGSQYWVVRKEVNLSYHSVDIYSKYM